VTDAEYYNAMLHNNCTRKNTGNTGYLPKNTGIYRTIIEIRKIQNTLYGLETAQTLKEKSPMLITVSLAISRQSSPATNIETFTSYETQTSHAICKASNKVIEQI